MRITGLRTRRLLGHTDLPATPWWGTRSARPLDIYPEFRQQAVRPDPQTDDGHFAVDLLMLYIDTDEGVSGMSGPISADTVPDLRRLAALLINRDPLAIDHLWEIMYRSVVNLRKGQPVFAISAIDCALWDLKGQWLNQPVYSLLGGPTRETIPAYASSLWYPLEPEAITAQVRRFREQGYTATKWFLQHGPAESRDGMRKNLEMVAAVREGAGDAMDIMFDCWKGWTLPYAVDMAQRMEPYDVRWLEEPVWPDKIGCLAELRSRTNIPISTGEHEYTRWGHAQLLEAGAADILQPDIYWAGGISEVTKICTLASIRDVQVIPHGSSPVAMAHVLAAQPADLCPLLEDLVRWNPVNQFFFEKPVMTVEGVVRPPQGPGLGVTIDESKIDSEETLHLA